MGVAMATNRDERLWAWLCLRIVYYTGSGMKGLAMRITTVKALASRAVAGMAEMKSAVRTESLAKHTASLIFLHGSGEFEPLAAIPP